MIYWSDFLTLRDIKASADLLYVMELSLKLAIHFQQLDFLTYVLTLNLRDTYLFGFNEANFNLATFGRRMETCGVFWLLLLFLLLRMLSFSSLLQSRCSDSQQRDLPQSSCVQGCSRCVVNSPASPAIHEPGLQHPAKQCWEKGSAQLGTTPWSQFNLLLF